MSSKEIDAATSPAEDDLLSALGSLPSGDVDARVARRIEKRAHSLLEQERRNLERPGVRRVARLYSRAIEPTLVAGACAIYLYSAFSAVFALLN
jgi:hypothetical protein